MGFLASELIPMALLFATAGKITVAAVSDPTSVAKCASERRSLT